MLFTHGSKLEVDFKVDFQVLTLWIQLEVMAHVDREIEISAVHMMFQNLKLTSKF